MPPRQAIVFVAAITVVRPAFGTHFIERRPRFFGQQASELRFARSRGTVKEHVDALPMLCQSFFKVGQQVGFNFRLVGEVLKRQDGLRRRDDGMGKHLLERLRNRKDGVEQIPVIEKVNLIFKIRGPAVNAADQSGIPQCFRF